jgi:hypothetical protein
VRTTSPRHTGRGSDAPLPSVPVPKGLMQCKCACGGTPGADGECARCKKERLSLQRRTAGFGERSTVPPIVHEVLRSPGQPLDTDTRSFMEGRFGHGFSRIRIHKDALAGESARAVNALAYTVGQDVVFGPGQYSPGTALGRRLLAHELTHTIQQESLGTNIDRCSLQIGSRDDAHENLAEQMGGAVSEEGTPQVSALAKNSISQWPVLQRHVLQRSCEHDEQFYINSPNYCFDDTWSPITHSGKRCYREIIQSSSLIDCPPREHVCFDANGECEASPDRSGLAESKEADGTCNWRWACVITHTLVDVLPAVLPLEEMGRAQLSCRESCMSLPWYLKGFCLASCNPMMIR